MRGTIIRTMRIEDLAAVFSMGRELFVGRDRMPASPWNERELAGILAGSMELCLVAEQKKRLSGFCIGSLAQEGDEAAAHIHWLGVREELAATGLASELVSAFMKNIRAGYAGRIVISVRPDDEELLSALRKIGFTESGHVLNMEAIFPK